MNKMNNSPKHVAIIMDGNGRWAEQRNLPREKGHIAGVEAAKEIINYCLELDINYLSLFAFSSENTRRPKNEINALVKLFIDVLKNDILDIQEKNISVKFVGDLNYFSDELVQLMHTAEEKTKKNRALKLIIAVNYGGRWDLIQAIRALSKDLNKKEIPMDSINEKLIGKYLITKDIPEPDLFIRTSGEQRISNFYLWQLAYTELYFTKVFWPMFNKEEFNKALIFYASRKRKYGRVF